MTSIQQYIEEGRKPESQKLKQRYAWLLSQIKKDIAMQKLGGR